MSSSATKATFISIPDIKNETREITIEINPEQIRQDKQIVKIAKRTDARISVGEDGNVNLLKQNIDGTIDTILTKNLNFNILCITKYQN